MGRRQTDQQAAQGLGYLFCAGSYASVAIDGQETVERRIGAHRA